MKIKTIIYAGYVISENEVEKASGVSVAGNKMQLALIEELIKYNDIKIIPLIVYPCAPYPKDNKFIYHQKQIEIISMCKGIQVGFINIPLIKQLTQAMGIYKNMKKLIRKFPEAEVVIFNAYPQVGNPAIKIQRKFGTVITAILADPPISYFQMGNNIIKKFIYKLFFDKTAQNLKKVNKVIALNKEAVNLFTPQAEHIIVEGGYKDIIDKKMTRVSYEERKCELVFSGSLLEHNGIGNLVEAMNLIKSEVTLHIYGDGPLRDYILKMCKLNSKIHYEGKVDNKEMLEIQRRAYLLVNPRPIDNIISKVTFPSKIFEYLSSGTAVISSKLNGITEEYYDKMYFFRGTTPQELAEGIDVVMQKNIKELEKIALKAQQFIIQKKSWKVQGKRIHDFLMDKNGEIV